MRGGGRFARTAAIAVAVITGSTVAPAVDVAAARPLVRAQEQADECVTSVLSGMNLAERAGQLFIAGVSSTAPTAAQLELIRTRHLGGAILMGNSDAGVTATRRVTDRLQAQATPETTDGVALWVAADQEGGYVQRLRGPGFSHIPTALDQGRLAPATLRRYAARWGDQLMSAGVNLNLAPVMDTVPADLGRDNEPIGYYYREYGHTPDVVRTHGMAFLRGMTDARMQTTVKHFPGLGRVRGNTDTTHGVTDDVTTRHDPYLEPFTAAVDAGVPGVMMSSARYLRIDPDHLGALSPTVLRGMLRSDLGHRGMIMSDSLSTPAYRDIPVERRAVRFVAAGGTVPLVTATSQVAPMVDAVIDRARAESGFRSRVDAAARTVLLAKWRAGLVPCPPGSNPITLHHTEIGGSSSYLGAPVGPEYRTAGGRARDYEGGSILWSARTGAHAVTGAIGYRYATFDGPRGVLGFPTTDERTTPDEIGRYNHFEGAGGSSIYWTPDTGAHAVQGAIRDRWASLGWERSTLGYPVSNEYDIPGGRRSDFQNGSILWDRSSNTTRVLHH